MDSCWEPAGQAAAEKEREGEREVKKLSEKKDSVSRRSRKKREMPAKNVLWTGGTIASRSSLLVFLSVFVLLRPFTVLNSFFSSVCVSLFLFRQ